MAARYFLLDYRILRYIIQKKNKTKKKSISYITPTSFPRKLKTLWLFVVWVWFNNLIYLNKKKRDPNYPYPNLSLSINHFLVWLLTLHIYLVFIFFFYLFFFITIYLLFRPSLDWWGTIECQASTIYIFTHKKKLNKIIIWLLDTSSRTKEKKN